MIDFERKLCNKFFEIKFYKEMPGPDQIWDFRKKESNEWIYEHIHE